MESDRAAVAIYGIHYIWSRDITLAKYILFRVKALDSGSVLNIGNGPQGGPSVSNAAKGRKEANHCIETPISSIWYTSGI